MVALRLLPLEDFWWCTFRVSASAGLNVGAFKKYIDTVPANQFVFRGQENHKWRLRTTFYRSKRSILERFLVDDVLELRKVFSGVVTYKFNIDDPLDYAAFLNLAQHHGYPTPLLDWTLSPYVAAFFCVSKSSGEYS